MAHLEFFKNQNKNHWTSTRRWGWKLLEPQAASEKQEPVFPMSGHSLQGQRRKRVEGDIWLLFRGPRIRLAFYKCS